MNVRSRVRLFDISFRARLLIALVGTVGLLGLASLAIVRVQTARQVDGMVRRTAERTQRALSELERFRRAELERIAMRITGSIRIVAALDAALEGGDPEEFVEHIRYELALAELGQGLVAFGDEEGRPVVTVVDGVRVPDQGADDDLFAQVIAGKGQVGGYRLFQERLFAVQAHRLDMFGEPVGTLTLGFAVDDDLASRLGAIVDAEVCFMAADRCVVGTAAIREAALSGGMARATRGDGPVFTTLGGRRVALVSNPLPATTRVMGVIAVPLEDVLSPFDRIQRVERIAAAGTVALAILLGIVLSKGLTTPIRTLMAATERVRRGDYDFSVQVPHRDELGTLADAFNQMTQGLLLKERYRGVLDKVVSPRIAEELMKGDLRLGGETREVTTLFADVRGFTTQTENMPPEQVIGMLNEWLELAASSIEEEGGVVDKYVGDLVMAIFGAPIPQSDHAARAVRAALRLRDRTEELSLRRDARGEQSFKVGIGINTGPAVAGNMGSTKRLNYTVLGASVNAAARLCSQAVAGQLLIAEETYRRVADQVEASRLPSRISKGFSRPITPYAVHGFRPQRGETRGTGSLSGTVLTAIGLVLAAPQVTGAQIFDLPTLSELGVRYVSPGGFVVIQPSVLIDLDGHIPQDEPAWHIDETGAFIAGRGRLFVDLFVGRRLYVSTELRVDRGQPARAGGMQGHLQQAFVRVMPAPGTNFTVQVGKFVSPFGSYPGRAQTSADPLIRPPLPYDYRTVMSSGFVPGASQAVFNWKSDPQRRSVGLPIVWEVPYPIGAMVAGGGGGWTLVAGVMNTAPSADPADWNRRQLDVPAGPSFVSRVSYQLAPEFQMGASYNHGSYMRQGVEDPSGPLTIGRQIQETRALDATFRRGHLDVRGELLFNRWEVFRVADDPRDVSYHIEARMLLAPGLFAAGRYSAIQFRQLAHAAGGFDRWDFDIQRWQLGAGYRLGRSTEVRGEYMLNRTLGRVDPRDNLVSLRWSWTF